MNSWFSLSVETVQSVQNTSRFLCTSPPNTPNTFVLVLIGTFLLFQFFFYIELIIFSPNCKYTNPLTNTDKLIIFVLMANN